MFPDRMEVVAMRLGKALDRITHISDSVVMSAEYLGFPYSISRRIIGHATPDIIRYESSLEGMKLPVYRRRDVNLMVEEISKSLIYSALSIGVNNPELPHIVVSIDNVLTDEPEIIDVFFNRRKNYQTPKISGKGDEGVTELTQKSEKIYSFFLDHRKGFEKALRVIDEEYPCKAEERDSVMGHITEECGLGFIKLQNRPRMNINTPERMRKIMEEAYG